MGDYPDQCYAFDDFGAFLYASHDVQLLLVLVVSELLRCSSSTLTTWTEAFQAHIPELIAHHQMDLL